MKIGLGLPLSDPARLLRWAELADAGPFSTLAIGDRLVYDNPEPLITLAALAGRTTRIRLQTEVLVAPLRDTALLGKQVATLDAISGGRLTFGVGIGNRRDDYQAAEAEYSRRGRRFEDQLAALRRIWAAQPYAEGLGPIGPAPALAGGPELLFGVYFPAAIERAARWGDGYLGGAPLDLTGMLFRAVEKAWQEAGRATKPRLVAQVTAALGPDEVVDQARAALRAYSGPGKRTDQVIADMLTTPQQVREAIAAYGDLGADEIVLYCWSSDIGQIDRLAHIVP
jgi:alkanesulfonate monooxygenase SsuD/methylene tetrahydromethanopterin reductase-like flavin-dependent oxidoreductase (luciferase family)